MKITYLGHACFLVEFGGKNLLFDPFITANPLASHIDWQQIKADYILITHGHQDHVLDVEAIAKNTDATLISNFEIITWFSEKGLKKSHAMNHGGKASFEFGTVKYVHAVHSSLLPDGSNGGNPGGFVVWGESGCFYAAGDTALTQDMQLIPLTCPQLDVAILPIGDNFTMGYEDAALAADFVQCNKVLGIHYNTFPPITIDTEKAQAYFASKGKELLLPKVGESVTI
ncbi:MAG: metal-dependent hydrolase [Cytophagales bacterium]|nr:metal-dependent hydrolase [Bernardetiaceae bacterium]MDW8203951.1 metal-dependent hydrolase [Cytophagales bacterium]